MGSKSAMSYFSHSGVNVPGSESSTYGTFALGSESTWERKFQLPQLQWFFCCIRNFNVRNFTDG